MNSTSDFKEPFLTQGFTTGHDWENEDFYSFEPLDDTEHITYQFKYAEKRFTIIQDQPPEMGGKREELKELIESLNTPKNLNFPSFWLRFLATFMFVVLILVVTIVLVMIWAMLILDLVFFALAIYILKKSVMLFWVLRAAIVNKGYFTNLRRKLKKLSKNNPENLRFTEKDRNGQEKQGCFVFFYNPSEQQLKVQKQLKT